MSSAPKTRQFLLDRCRTKYSWAAGVTRGTPSAIQWHRKDLDTAFAEIDGLMAGLRYQDKVERCRSQAAASPLPQNPLGAADEHADLLGTRQYPTQLLDEHLPDLSAATIENHTAAAAASVPSSPAEPIPGAEHQPMATQWAALRNLRDETAFHHKRFEQLCRDLGDPTISKLLEIYPDAQSIRNQGAQLVKDVLEGFRPRELSLVFAFVSFAYAISQLLYKKGRIDQSEILADLKVWRSLILDSRERQAFDLIAQRLWPEAKDHLHFIPVVAQHRVAQFPHLSSGDVGLTESAITDFLSSPAHGQDATDQHIGLFGTDQFGFGNAASHIGQQDVINPEVEVAWAGSLMKKSNGEFAFDHLQLAAASSPNNEFFHQAPSCFGWTQPDSTDHPGSPSPRGGTPDVFGGGREQPQPTKPGPVSKEVELEDSGIFLVVLVFLLDIADLVYTLSGRSLASRRHKLYKAEERDQEGFYKFARETFFKPHRQELQTPAFSALLYVAEKFTKGGLLRSIAEIKHYLVSVATAVSPPGDLFEQILLSVLASPSNCPSTPPLNTHRRKRQRFLSDLEEESVTLPKAKKRRTHKSEQEGSNVAYSDRSALRKHQDQLHRRRPIIKCDECDYGNQRRDRVRSHFLSNHPGIELPEILREMKRGISSQASLAGQGQE